MNNETSGQSDLWWLNLLILRNLVASCCASEYMRCNCINSLSVVCCRLVESYGEKNVQLKSKETRRAMSNLMTIYDCDGWLSFTTISLDLMTSGRKYFHSINWLIGLLNFRFPHRYKVDTRARRNLEKQNAFATMTIDLQISFCFNKQIEFKYLISYAAARVEWAFCLSPADERFKVFEMSTNHCCKQIE